MTPDDIIEYCLTNLCGTVLVNTYGEKCIFYNPERKLKRGIYVLTIKDKDGSNDKSSLLDRENIYRLSIGIRKNSFIKLFGFIPQRPSKAGTVNMNYDWTILNSLIPHPVYAWMGWVCILNPDAKSFNNLIPYIVEAYEYAKEKYNKKRI